MPDEDKISLAEARKRGKIDQFIAEREEQVHADQEAFEATLASMAGKSKPEEETSPPDCDED